MNPVVTAMEVTRAEGPGAGAGAEYPVNGDTAIVEYVSVHV